MSEPEVSVRIDPAMRALWRARRGGVPAPERPVRPAPPPPPEATMAADPAPARAARRPAATARIALRRDGARPLAFDGAPALRSERIDGETGARFAIALYVAADETAVVGLSMSPPEDVVAREIHLADRVAGADELDRLLDRLDPAAALPAALDMEPGRAAEIDAAAGALRAAYDRFRAGLGGAETPNPLWRTTP